jgi:hypothetical protein
MIDIKIPRQAIYRNFEDDPGTCPNCGGALVNENQTYMTLGWRGRKMVDSLVIGGRFGWFCESCPIIVLDEIEIRKTTTASTGGVARPEVEYKVLGIVDMGAVPEHKRQLPIGSKDNPMSIITFTNPDERAKLIRVSPPAPKKADIIEEPKPTPRSKHRKRRK